MPDIPDLEALEAERNRRAQNKILRYYPEAGPLRRELYPKHIQTFANGAEVLERLALFGNRTGKTEGVGCYELSLHLTGRYPEWWPGHRFKRAIKAWAAGDTSKTVREILQEKLLGPLLSIGTGMIPGDAIYHKTMKSGVSDAVDTIDVRHVSGGISKLVLKSYDQRREGFQGTEQDFILLDEECPEAIYRECATRTMTTNGHILLTFTPLQGLTPLVLDFIPGGDVDRAVGSGRKDRRVTSCTWWEVPHLTPEQIERMLLKYPPAEREARSKGTPSLGAGAIYPVPEEDVAVDEFRIPAHWPKAWALDTGWNNTACVWGALNRETETVYIYDVYKRGSAEPPIHAEAIRARGQWIPGVGDAAAINNYDGRQFIDIYRQLGLDIQLPDKSVEAGIHDVWQRLSTGKLKVFRRLSIWFEEFRLYRRDEAGKIVKANDHLMDCTKYLVRSGIQRMITEPVKREKEVPEFYSAGPNSGLRWMS